MTRAQAAILPSAILGCLVVVIIGVFISSQMTLPATLLNPVIVQAQPEPAAVATEQPAQAAPAEEQAQPAQEQPPADTGECNISQKFPQAVMQWCGLISRYAKENQMDPNLVASVMLQESGGNPQAYSKSGAVGLLQVMPRDGLAAAFQCAAGPCFSSRPTIKELKDPEFNVAYGTQMLSGLVQKYGDIREALRYYGPKDVGYYYADIVLTIFQSYQ